MLFELVALSDAHALAIWQEVVIQVWERPLEPAVFGRELERTLDVFKRMRRERAERTVLAFSLVSKNASLPGPQHRAIAAEFPSYFDYFVGVHEGPEHRTTLVNTAIEAMALAARVEPSYELVADVKEACAKLAARSAGSFEGDELSGVISELRLRIAAGGPV